MRSIVLASTSKRRKEIFSLLNIPFIVSSPKFNEDNTLKMSPDNLVKYIAHEKANSLVGFFESAIIISSDTLVVNKGIILPKPKSKNEAIKMLLSLSNNTHSVLTGYAIIDTLSGKKNVGIRKTQITFKKISSKEARLYVNKENVLGAAGAYDHEHLGSIFVSNINGDYFSSIGLPLFEISQLLKNNYSINIL